MSEGIAIGILGALLSVIAYLALKLRRARMESDLKTLKRGESQLDEWLAKDLAELRELSDEELRGELERMFYEKAPERE